MGQNEKFVSNASKIDLLSGLGNHFGQGSPGESSAFEYIHQRVSRR
jgi:hypothetical protein